MSKRIFFSLACDTDPDIDLPFRPPHGRAVKGMNTFVWRGITEGIYNLRQRLRSADSALLGVDAYSLPITWLLRSDRQIYEIYGDPTFCSHEFENIWNRESNYGSEIGWHRHLFRWSDKTTKWIPYLGFDDDIGILSDCLTAMRRCIDISAVRTGWDYHSNRLMQFFDDQKLIVDASALPGCSQTGVYFYDWSNAPRAPYFPSRSDYRRKGESPEDALTVIEMPVLVRRVSLASRMPRYVIRRVRGIRYHTHNFPVTLESAGWQGVVGTSPPDLFMDALRQTTDAYSDDADMFVSTYFHTKELLSQNRLDRLVLNLENVAQFAHRKGFEMAPVTLSAAASYGNGRCAPKNTD